MLPEWRDIPSTWRQSRTALARPPAAQELFYKGTAHAELVSDFRLGVVVVIFIEPDDAFAKVIGDWKRHALILHKPFHTRNCKPI
jgi:hypothetical protein